MKLSIITITYNNAEGLRRTIQSVQSQTFSDFEHVIVDGGSTDGSMEIIETYALDVSCITNSCISTGGEGCCIAVESQDYTSDRAVQPPAQQDKASLKATQPHKVIWLSEPDKGVYDAQNKGICLAQGDYCYFLNAGDTFCVDDVLEKMFSQSAFNLSPLTSNLDTALPHILYGNEIIVDGNGNRVGIARGVENPSFLDLYNSCMKHQASFIHRSLFEQYGMYDADMRICSDFDWFFRVIAFHNEVTLQYKDVDIAYFENTGISYHNPELCLKERQQILDRYMSKRMQRDYLLLGRYPRLSRVGENKMVKLLLRIANRLLK